jgi:hypothetical protein
VITDSSPEDLREGLRDYLLATDGTSDAISRIRRSIVQRAAGYPAGSADARSFSPRRRGS